MNKIKWTGLIHVAGKAAIHGLLFLLMAAFNCKLSRVLDAAEVSHGLLSDACNNGFVRTVNFLIRRRIDLDYVPHGRNRLLYENAVRYRYEIVKLLLDGGVARDGLSGKDLTALHGVIARGTPCNEEQCFRMVSLLLRNGADCNIPDENGKPPLYSAIDLQYDRVVDLLLQNGTALSEIYIDKRKFGRQEFSSEGLCYALSRRSSAAVIQVLLRHGASLYPRLQLGDAPCALAMKVRDPEVMDILLHAGLQAKNDPSSILHLWVKNNRRTWFRKLQILDVLLRHGCDINSLNYRGRTLLIEACDFEGRNDKQNNSQIRQIHAVLSRRANIYTKSSSGDSPIRVILGFRPFAQASERCIKVRTEALRLLQEHAGNQSRIINICVRKLERFRSS